MNFKFFYPATKQRQTLHVRSKYETTPCGIGHILLEDWNGDKSLLCGGEMQKIETATGANAHIIQENRIEHLEMCHDCQEAWKKLPQGEWQNWIKSIAG